MISISIFDVPETIELRFSIVSEAAISPSFMISTLSQIVLTSGNILDSGAAYIYIYIHIIYIQYTVY